MKVVFTEDAKMLVTALKVMCGECRVLPIKVDPVAGTMFIAQKSDNNVAWIELNVTGLEITHGHSESIETVGVVESKALFSAIKTVSTLKDSLEFEFVNDIASSNGLGINVSVYAKDGGETSAFLPFQDQEVSYLVTTLCGSSSIVAGTIDAPTKELESLIKDVSHKTGGVRIEAKVDVDGIEKIFVGGIALEDMTVLAKNSGYGFAFDQSALVAFFRNALGAEVTLQLYKDLPLKISYTLFGGKKKKGTRKSTSVGASRAANLQILISPRT